METFIDKNYSLNFDDKLEMCPQRGVVGVTGYES